jgi:hypothetical protein
MVARWAAIRRRLMKQRPISSRTVLAPFRLALMIQSAINGVHRIESNCAHPKPLAENTFHDLRRLKAH